MVIIFFSCCQALSVVLISFYALPFCTVENQSRTNKFTFDRGVSKDKFKFKALLEKLVRKNLVQVIRPSALNDPCKIQGQRLTVTLFSISFQWLHLTWI